MSSSSQFPVISNPTFFVTSEIIQLEKAFIDSIENGSATLQQRVEKIAKLCLGSFVTTIAFILEGVWSCGGLRDTILSRVFVLDGAPRRRLPMTSFLAHLVQKRWNFKPISDESASKVFEAARNLNSAAVAKFIQKYPLSKVNGNCDSANFMIDMKLFSQDRRVASYWWINSTLSSMLPPHNNFTAWPKKQKEKLLSDLAGAAKALNQVPQNMEVGAQ